MANLKENLKKMGCGACGGTEFNVYTADAKQSLVVACANPDCNGVSVVKPAAPRLVIGWGDDMGVSKESDGILAVFG